MSDFRDKVSTIAAPRRLGTSRTIVKRDERDGSVAGRETEHWDDRRDATVIPKALKLKMRAEEV